MSIIDAPDGSRSARRRATVVLGAAAVLALAVVAPQHHDDAGGAWIRTATPVAGAELPGGLSPVGTDIAGVTLVPGTPPPAAAGSTTTSVAGRRQGAPPAPTTTGPAGPSVPTTVAVLMVPTAGPLPSPTIAPRVATAPPAPTTTSTAGPPLCRNSTTPACGPFRFDPQPGADGPMTVQVVPEATAPGGRTVVFHITLTDPDGASYGSSTFGFGDSGIGESSATACDKFGPWDPPARNAAAAVQTQDVRHTYAAPGTYRVTFSFDPAPYSCVDSVTGRGDRPYASPGTATVDVVVG